MTPRQMKTHREAVQDMKPLAAVDYLLAVIETLDVAQDDCVVGRICQQGFTATESRILAKLAEANGNPVRRESLYSILIGFGGRRGELPSDNLLAAHIRNIRRKLAGNSPRFEIRNIHGFGYSLYRVSETDTGFPWEAP